MKIDVAPLAGAWIEITEALPEESAAPGSLLAGATIEIEKTIVYNVLCDYIEGGYLLSKTVRQSDWATETLMEAPFWRNGMTLEEYEMENRYLSKNFYKQKDGNYMLLWMQEENMKA